MAVSFVIIVGYKNFPFSLSTGKRKDPHSLAHWKEGFKITLLIRFCDLTQNYLRYL